MGASRESIALEKWYLDCTGEDRTAIVYWTALEWRGLSVSWHSAAVYSSGQPPLERSSLARVAAPARNGGDVLRFDSDAIGCSLRCVPLRPPFSRRLFGDEDGGAVDWHCEAAAARVTIELTGVPTIAGLGYVERLRLTIPPWRLPIEELRWGRWIADDGEHALVWIDWSGSHPLTFVFADGEPSGSASVSDAHVNGGAFSLTLGDAHSLVSRNLGETIRSIGPLATLVPDSLLRASELKWRSRGSASGFGGASIAGSAVHEVVRFRDYR